jgi:hypothetical protein
MTKYTAFIFPLHNQVFCLSFFKSPFITNNLPQISGKLDKRIYAFSTHALPDKND